MIIKPSRNKTLASKPVEKKIEQVEIPLIEEVKEPAPVYVPKRVRKMRVEEQNEEVNIEE